MTYHTYNETLFKRLGDLENASLEDLREGIVWAQEEGAHWLEAGNTAEVDEWSWVQSKLQAEMDRRLGWAEPSKPDATTGARLYCVECKNTFPIKDLVVCRCNGIDPGITEWHFVTVHGVKTVMQPRTSCLECIRLHHAHVKDTVLI